MKSHDHHFCIKIVVSYFKDITENMFAFLFVITTIYQLRTRMTWIALHISDQKLLEQPRVTFRLQTFSKVSAVLCDERIPSAFCWAADSVWLHAKPTNCNLWQPPSVVCGHMHVWTVIVWESVWCGRYECVLGIADCSFVLICTNWYSPSFLDILLLGALFIGLFPMRFSGWKIKYH